MGEFAGMFEQRNSFFCRNDAGMLLKTKERCGKSRNEAGMYMKIKGEEQDSVFRTYKTKAHILTGSTGQDG